MTQSIYTWLVARSEQQVCMEDATGFPLPCLVGMEANGDFQTQSELESIAATQDGRFIAISFTATDTQIVGTGNNPKVVALFDLVDNNWLFVKKINEQHQNFPCNVYLNDFQVLAQYSQVDINNNIFPAFQYINYDGSSDGHVVLRISGATNFAEPYSLDRAGLYWQNTNESDLWVAINYTINETVPGANSNGDRRLALCIINKPSGLAPTLNVCKYYEVESTWSYLFYVNTVLHAFSHPNPTNFKSNRGLLDENRLFVCTQSSDSNTSVFHVGMGALDQLQKIPAGDTQNQNRFFTQCELIPVTPSVPATSDYYLFKLVHKLDGSFTEWQVAHLNWNLTEARTNQLYKQRTTKYKFLYLAAKAYDINNWEAVAFDFLTSQTFFVHVNVGAWRMTVYEFPNASQSIRSAVILDSGRVFYAGSATFIETYNKCLVPPFASNANYMTIFPTNGGQFTSKVGYFSEYSRASNFASGIRFNPSFVFDCDNNCAGVNQIVTGDDSTSSWNMNVASDISLIEYALPLDAANPRGTVWLQNQDTSWRKAKYSATTYTIVPSVFDADNVFSVILDQPSPLAFAEWTYIAGATACSDGAPQFQIRVTLNPAGTLSTDLNASLTRNSLGNGLVWDMLNEVPSSFDPNVISMNSSNQAILPNTYTVTVFAKFKNYQSGSQTFEVNIFQACRFATFPTTWSANGANNLATDYKIGKEVLQFAYSGTITQNWCPYQQQLQFYDGSQWQIYLGSSVTITPSLLEVNTGDLSLDTGPQPSTTRFRIVFGSPNLLEANTKTFLYIDVTLKHPCRYAAFEPQIVQAMKYQIYKPSIQQVIPLLVHSEEPTNCGIEILSVLSCLPITVASCNLGSFMTIAGLQVSLFSNDEQNEGVYQVSLVVSSVTFPAISLSLAPFTITITTPCRVVNTQMMLPIQNFYFGEGTRLIPHFQMSNLVTTGDCQLANFQFEFGLNNSPVTATTWFETDNNSYVLKYTHVMVELGAHLITCAVVNKETNEKNIVEILPVLLMDPCKSTLIRPFKIRDVQVKTGQLEKFDIPEIVIDKVQDDGSVIQSDIKCDFSLSLSFSEPEIQRLGLIIGVPGNQIQMDLTYVNPYFAKYLAETPRVGCLTASVTSHSDGKHVKSCFKVTFQNIAERVSDEVIQMVLTTDDFQVNPFLARSSKVTIHRFEPQKMSSLAFNLFRDGTIEANWSAVKDLNLYGQTLAVIYKVSTSDSPELFQIVVEITLPRKEACLNVDLNSSSMKEINEDLFDLKTTYDELQLHRNSTQSIEGQIQQRTEELARLIAENEFYQNDRRFQSVNSDYMKIRIKKISETGMVAVQFNSRFGFADWFSDVVSYFSSEDSIESFMQRLDFHQCVDPCTGKRQINGSLPCSLLPLQKKPLLQLSMIMREFNQEETDKDQFKFSWQIDSFDNQTSTFLIQLNFERPEEVSVTSQSEYLRIDFNFPGYFKSLDGKKLTTETVVSVIPKQHQTRTVKLFQTIYYVSVALLIASLLGNFVVNVLAKVTRNLIWSIVNQNQMIVFLPLLEVNYPVNAFGLKSVISLVANGPIPSEGWKTIFLKMFDFGPQTPFSQVFANYNKHSHSILLNSGSPFCIFYGSLIFLPLLLVAFNYLNKAFGQNLMWIRETHRMLKAYLEYTYFLRTFQEVYLSLAIYSLANLYGLNEAFVGLPSARILQQSESLKSEFVGDILSGILGVVTAIVVAIGPIVIFYILLNNRSSLQDSSFQSKYGELYQQIREKNSLYVVAFLARRLSYALLIVCLRGYVGMQIIGISYIQTAYIIYLGQARPFQAAADNKRELFTEVLFMLCIYHIFCFTDWVATASSTAVFNFGWSLCAVIYFIILRALGLTLWTTITTVRQQLKALSIQKMQQKHQLFNLKKLQSLKEQQKKEKIVDVANQENSEDEEAEIRSIPGLGQNNNENNKFSQQDEEVKSEVISEEVKKELIQVKPKPFGNRKILAISSKCSTEEKPQVTIQESTATLQQNNSKRDVKIDDFFWLIGKTPTKEEFKNIQEKTQVSTGIPFQAVTRQVAQYTNQFHQVNQQATISTISNNEQTLIKSNLVQPQIAQPLFEMPLLIKRTQITNLPIVAQSLNRADYVNPSELVNASRFADKTDNDSKAVKPEWRVILNKIQNDCKVQVNDTLLSYNQMEEEIKCKRQV